MNATTSSNGEAIRDKPDLIPQGSRTALITSMIHSATSSALRADRQLECLASSEMLSNSETGDREHT